MDSVRSLILKYDITTKKNLQRLLTSLSYFSVETSPSFSIDIDFRIPEVPPIYRVAENIISRGLPTRPSLGVEQYINNLLSEFGLAATLDREASNIGSIKFNMEDNEQFARLLWRSLHAIDPYAGIAEITTPPGTTGSIYASQEERTFIELGLPSVLPPYLTQFIESERNIDSLLALEQDPQSVDSNTPSRDFIRQRVDFCLELPYANKTNRGYVFEIDGTQHKEPRQQFLDAKRDEELKNAGFTVIRIPTDNVENPGCHLEDLSQALQQDNTYLSIVAENVNHPLQDNPAGELALHAALIPFAVSRLLKVFLRFINSGKLDLDADSWHIVVIERDVKCAQLACNDLQQLIHALAELSGQKDLPEIILERLSFNEVNNSQTGNSTNADTTQFNTFDLYIDISMLSRDFSNAQAINIPAKNTCIIRSSRAIESSRHFLFAPNIDYMHLGEYIADNGENAFIEDPKMVSRLELILVDIFRKTSFRSGQLEILNRALQNENVIGLLPTGHGKSLIYQLAGLLQPGICATIDPLKSLMRDQDRGLRDNHIDGSVYVNSSLSTLERVNAIDKLASGEVLFAFIAPERLQSQEFRNTLTSANLKEEISFSYCVIDEAHCVSEWGHDFRTSYLRVGKNARKFCKSWQRNEVPLIALTATASYDVLADIQRELGVEGGDSIVTLKEGEMRRDELNFRIIDTSLSTEDLDHIDLMSFWDIRRAVSEGKENKLTALLAHTDLKNEPTIVFCPHKKGEFGVVNLESKVYSNCEQRNWNSGTFMGTSGLSFNEAQQLEEKNQETQDRFIANDIDILFATKAFGMGIDKHNIRNIYHFNFPSSIEGYYQEAGRAGRDRKPSTCTILYCSQQFNELHQGETATLDSGLMLSFHENSFKGISFERRWLNELLNNIHAPKTSPEEKATHAIEAMLRQHINIDNCNLSRKENYLSIFINPDMGFFDLKSSGYPYRRTKTTRYTLPAKLVQAAQEILQSYLNHEDVRQDNVVGIEKLLVNMPLNERRMISIPFENDAADEIAEFASNSHISVTRETVIKAASYCKNADMFANRLEEKIREFSREFEYSLPSNKIDEIKNRFFSIRDQEATMKSVYRLMSIGVIYDYTVDYLTRKIDCRVIKKNNDQYKEDTSQYLKKYYADERVEAIMATLDRRPGNTTIQKCLNLIIEFTYEEIAKQRRSAIEEMERACNYGLEHPDSDSFEEYIMMYMNSKYARRHYLPADTNNGSIENMSIVDKYINIVRNDTGGEINNLKHLRGAAALMHSQRPDNYVFLLLDAFATFILEKERNTLINKAADKAIAGFERYAEEKHLSLQELGHQIDSFADKIAQFDNEAAIPLRDLKGLLTHKRHLNWLKQYKKEKPYAKKIKQA